MDVERAANTPDSGGDYRIGRSISLDHAAELLGISRRAVYYRIRRGLLRTILLNSGTRRVLVESVSDYLRSKRESLEQTGVPSRRRYR
jgi:hypothetical protein